ncbi:MAG: enoyl-ACP reductase FabI [Solirubrobacteraceae bacterium]|nr:enoyl-ACP reductase FabI [Solirubrobacteraceae bacterium]
MPQPASWSAAPATARQRLVITGVLTKQSIAWEVARQAQEAGAEIVLTGFGRTRRMTERSARSLHTPADVLELDVDSPEDLAALQTELAGRWGAVDGVLHAIAFAPSDAIGGDFLATPKASATTAFEVSAYSLKALSVALLPLLKESPSGGSVVGLDFDAAVAWPSYDWMGVAKAALESVSRYLARYLGPHGVRVNLVAAGPLKTLAAGGISGFDELAGGWADQAPLGWDPADVAPVAEVVRFLLSPASRAMTGEILHVDGGRHAMGGPIAC